MRIKTIRTRICAALALVALVLPAAAYGQSDSFFYIDEEPQRGQDYNGGSWDVFGFGETPSSEDDGSWTAFEDGNIEPLGDGLLILAATGACYAAIKQRKRKEKRETRKK